MAKAEFTGKNSVVGRENVVSLERYRTEKAEKVKLTEESDRDCFTLLKADSESLSGYLELIKDQRSLSTTIMHAAHCLIAWSRLNSDRFVVDPHEPEVPDCVGRVDRDNYYVALRKECFEAILTTYNFDVKVIKKRFKELGVLVTAGARYTKAMTIGGKMETLYCLDVEAVNELYREWNERVSLVDA